MKRAAVYIRVSTQEQAEHGYSVGEQKERLLAYCKAKDWAVYDVYIDGGYTGSNLDRPGIQKLREDIKNFDVVLVYKLDRLSRSQFDILDLIEKTFLPAGVDFVSMSEAFDTSTPFGRAMIGILGVFAQLEREQTKERTAMGRKARAKSGKWHGGARDPLGYDYVDGKLVINEYEAEQVRLIYKMAAENYSGYDIIRALINAGYKMKYGEWSLDTGRSKIKRVLERPLNYGAIAFKGDIIEDAGHEPIVTKELYDKANQVWESRLKKYGRGYASGTTLLSGLLWCGHCGAKYVVLNSKSYYKDKVYRNKYLACYNRAYPKPSLEKGTQNPKCKNKSWKPDEMETVVERKIIQLEFEGEIDFVIHQNTPEMPDNSKILKQIEAIDKQMKKLMGLYSVNSIPLELLSSEIESLNQNKADLKKQIVDDPKKEQSTIKILEFKELVSNLATIWSIAGMERKRNLLSFLIKRIVVHGENLKIEWIFE